MGTHTLEMPTRRLSFSAKNPKLQIAYDSVSLGMAKTCYRKYQLGIIEGWVPKHESHHLKFGQLYHRALEVYDHHIFAGESHEKALQAALWDLKLGCTVLKEDGTCEWWNPHEFLSEEKAKRDKKTVPHLFRTVILYLDKFGARDPCKTVRLKNGKPAVEVSFRYELGHKLSTGEEAEHSGHMDRLVELSSLVYVLDRKTTGTTITGKSAYGFFAKFTPDNQITGYVNAGQIVLPVPVKGAIIDAAQIAEGFSAFERGFALRTPAQLEEWRADVIYIISELDRMAQADYWPMNDTACDLYGGCHFRDVCSRDPSVREMYLKSDFQKRPWDPLAVRGDI